MKTASASHRKQREEESCGNGGAVESVESQRQASPSFHEPLGNLAKRRRDSHISTAPASVGCQSEEQGKRLIITEQQPRSDDQA
jgi:hypothetical protein